MDPISRREFWDILLSLKRDGSSLLVSTPYMDEVSLADRAVLLHRGRKLAEGTPAELARRFRGAVYRLREQPTRSLMERLGEAEGFEARRFGSSVRITAPEDTPAERIDEALDRFGITSRVEAVEPDLEDVFVQMVEA